MSIKAVLIDDEKHNLDNLQELLKAYCPQVTVVATALSADEGASIILKHQPDIVFLDIQMPNKTGFDLLRGLSSYDFEVIFVTAFDNYAIQAMRFAAIDYLLKPIDINELQSAVDRAIKKCRLKVQNQQLENLIHLLKSQQNKEEQRIALTTLKETRFVKTSEIIRCESSNNYTSFFLQGDEELLVCKPIYEFEEILKDYGFIRCHQSHLVNKKFVKSWKKEYGDFLLLLNGSEVPVSRNKKDTVKKALETG
ncbi:LytTR family DNA-binding domain-containing protein [Mucilaginibacter sp. BJC16-A38]|uniref:LytR/AlgR family response regulator transcription factor n=1 Tax=Mucilaginibacter phenanthrenivorans TaxID=1234842 RepID=UPI002158142B|nr:LytTR family DNA-binding domain-containing protein [Mucilaginibacter phenanthrenivorans]MCR8559408.1 LytTR family DNA-binding domain-containing protein [Mucilaginibacter phenanthrenivorans]